MVRRSIGSPAGHSPTADSSSFTLANPVAKPRPNEEAD